LINFSEFEKTRYFQKIPQLQKPNYSKTRENKKFGKFHLKQGLSGRGSTKVPIFEIPQKVLNNLYVYIYKNIRNIKIVTLYRGGDNVTKCHDGEEGP
jgi:hypothetical protein